MYLGIDLGTSNSSIVGNDNGSLKVFKTPEGADILPSCVMLDRRGNLFVGKRAYEQLAYAPDNVRREFKRLMGTSSALTFAGIEKTLTPEEASAEVLKALVAQARMSAGDFELDGAVITVPAAFNQMQSEATMAAARLAGLDRVALLQEPIAAALAAIANAEHKTGQFLVYDLGGGTFDAAIVNCVSGNATVVAHAGINMLGGRDFDRDLVNTVVRPWLLDTFDLAQDFVKTHQKLIRVAQYRAEISKIALSTQFTDRIFADENQVNTKDGQGRDVYIDVEIDRSTLEELVKDDIDQTIDLCRKLIATNGYRPEDIDSVVLIGGPTQMPIVRNRVGAELGIRTDLKMDPMTAVGVGAAIYAESRDWSAFAGQPKSFKSSVVVKSSIDLKLDYPSRTTDKSVNVKIQCAKAAKGLRLQLDSDIGWTSGQITLAESNEVTGVPIPKQGDNKIRVSVFDAYGHIQQDAGTEFTVVRVSAAADGMPLMHNISVKVVSGTLGDETNKLHLLVAKGTTLPKSGSMQFSAARNFSSRDTATLDFEVYQHPDGIETPELALMIGAFRLSPDQLELGEVIRRGDAVNVAWSLDSNGLLSCDFAIEKIVKSYKVSNLYVPSMGHQSFEGSTGYKLAADMLRLAGQDVDNLDRALSATIASDIATMRYRLKKLNETLRIVGDADTLRRLYEEGLLIRQEVAQIRSKREHVVAVLRAEVERQLEVAARNPLDASTKQTVAGLAEAAKLALQRGTEQSIEDAKRSIKQIWNVIHLDLQRRPDVWITAIYNLSRERDMAVDKNKHDALVRASERAIASRDVAQLKSLYYEMHGNMLKSADPAQILNLSGLMAS